MFALIRPFVPYIIMAVVATLGLGGTYWFIRHQGAVAEREAQFKREVVAYQAAIAKANAVSKALEGELASAQLEVKKVNERLNHELIKEPVYRECRVPVSGVQLLNAARTGTAPAR